MSKKTDRLLALADLLLDDRDTPCNTPSDIAFPWMGENVAIRSVTHYYTGKAKRIVGGFVILGEAAWIANTGRWSAFLADGTPDEIEPCPDELAVSLGAIVDVAPWGHALPRKVK